MLFRAFTSSCLAVVLLIGCHFLACSAFLPHHHKAVVALSSTRYHHKAAAVLVDRTHYSSSIRMAVYDKDDARRKIYPIGGGEAARDPLTRFSMDDLFAAPTIDSRSVTLLLVTQAALLGVTAGLGSLFGVNPIALPGSFSFDTSSMMFASQIAIALIAFGFVIDRLPFQASREIARDTKIFTLRVLGRGTQPLVAAGVALLLSLGAGFSEEVAFRGFIFLSLDQSVGQLFALLVSSIIFGFAHFPIYGSSTLLECFFGGVFAYGYYASGYNLAVPIAAHTMYDFATMFLTWSTASADFKKRLTETEGLLQQSSSTGMKKDVPLAAQMDYLAAGAFNILDSDKDGVIDEKEFSSGLYLFGLGSIPLRLSNMDDKKMFQSLDKNKDGKVSLEEFSSFFRDVMKQWLSMF